MSGIVNSTGARSGIVGGLLPAGTVMVFAQASAPTGWTKSTANNDKALRVVNGSGGGTGGSVAFETAFASQSTTPTITMSNAPFTLLDPDHIPSHNHTVRYASGTTTPNEWSLTSNGWTYTNVGTTGRDLGHTHSNTASSNAVTFNLDVSYVDVIIATKD